MLTLPTLRFSPATSLAKSTSWQVSSVTAIPVLMPITEELTAPETPNRQTAWGIWIEGLAAVLGLVLVTVELMVLESAPRATLTLLNTTIAMNTNRR